MGEEGHAAARVSRSPHRSRVTSITPRGGGDHDTRAVKLSAGQTFTRDGVESSHRRNRLSISPSPLNFQIKFSFRFEFSNPFARERILETRLFINVNARLLITLWNRITEI